MSDERLSDVTRSVSLLARWSPTPAVSGWFPGDIVEEDTEARTSSCPVRLRRLSGPIVYGRVCGVRRRTASRCSLALPLGDDEDDGDEEEEEAVAAIAMITAEEEAEKGGGEKRGGEEESWWWW